MHLQDVVAAAMYGDPRIGLLASMPAWCYGMHLQESCKLQHCGCLRTVNRAWLNEPWERFRKTNMPVIYGGAFGQLPQRHVANFPANSMVWLHEERQNWLGR